MAIFIPSERPSNRRRLFLLGAALIALGAIALGRAIMLPFVLACVFAYVLTPAVAWVEKRRLPRAAAIVLVYIVVLGTIGTFVRIVTPRLVHELGGVRRELPTIGKTLQEKWVPGVQARLKEWGLAHEETAEPKEASAEQPAFEVSEESDGTTQLIVRGGLAVRPDHHGGYLVEAAQDEGKPPPFDINRMVADGARKSLDYAQKNIVEIVKFGQEIVRRVSAAIFIFSLSLMLAAYMMLTREKLVGFFRGLVRPSGRAGFDTLLWRMDRGLSGVVRGQLVICVLNGLLSAIGFALVGLKYWPVMALIATVLSLIPIFGSIISTIPAVAIGLTQGIGTAAFVLIWILVIHQLEANILNPKIMGDSAKIHPVLVVFSLLLGEHLFHTVGALLAVPCMSLAQSVFLHFRHALEASDPDFDGEVMPLSLPPSKLSRANSATTAPSDEEP